MHKNLNGLRTEAAPKADFDVVILGAGLNSLNLTLAFHEQYAITPTVVMRTPVAVNTKSATTTPRVLGSHATDADLLRELERIGQEHQRSTPHRPLLLLTNADSLIEFINTHRATLARWYRFALLQSELLAKIADKAEFAQICSQIGIPTPPTVIVDFSSKAELAKAVQTPLPWSYPVVAKAANTAEYSKVSFAGKKKVFFIESESQRIELLRALENSGFLGRFLFQEAIEGDDTQQYSVTLYRSTQGDVTLAAAAQVLLGEHTPEALGRPAAMVTGPHHDLMDAAERFLNHIDYVGFANFDIKVDPKTGEKYFLELNPRIGRNNYYVTAAGENVARHIVEDLAYGNTLSPLRVTRSIVYSILPKRLVLSYLRDEQLRNRIRSTKSSEWKNPYRYPGESVWMKTYSVVSGLNFMRKYKKVYPRPTDTGF